jgi:hypothetical protein
MPEVITTTVTFPSTGRDAPNAVNHFDRWVATTAKCVIPA